MFSHYTNKKSAIIDLVNEMLQLYNYMCKSDKSNRLHDPMCCPNVSPWETPYTYLSWLLLNIF